MVFPPVMSYTLAASATLKRPFSISDTTFSFNASLYRLLPSIGQLLLFGVNLFQDGTRSSYATYQQNPQRGIKSQCNSVDHERVDHVRLQIEITIGSRLKNGLE